MIISLAPLQGYTEFPFRNAMASIIGGIDKFYTPFLRFENDGSLRNKHLNDIKPENNKTLKLIPQILVNNTAHFIELAKLIEDNGYSELNWNLGCPYPMVAKRKLGSGLLAHTETIQKILDETVPKTKLDISVKLRSGYENDQEVFKVIEVLNAFPINEIIYHPRIGKQLYKGYANFDLFKQLQQFSKIPLAYNGDIDTVDKYNEVLNSEIKINHYMIGRGLISNPFLAQEIKGEQYTIDEKRQLLKLFYNELFEHYKNTLSGDTHILNKMIHFWEYFSQLFIESKKVYKLLKKCRNIISFQNTADKIIQTSDMK